MRREANHSEFEARMREHRGIVFKLAGIYAAPEDREDLAQEIYLQLWRAFGRYDAERPFATWMYRVALNTAISFARGAGRRERFLQSTADPDDLPSASGDRDDRIEDVYRVIRTLDELNRALILLHLEGHTYREIAEVLGISETNVSTKLNRLRERMRKDLTSAGTAAS